MAFDVDNEPRNRAERRAAARRQGKGRRAAAAALTASGAALASTAMLFGPGAAPVGAAVTLTVDDTSDGAAQPTDCTTPVANQCSLRDAVAAANDGDTIQFALPALSTIALANHITIDKSVAITGPGAAALTIDAGGNDRVFYITDGTNAIKDVTISGLTITGGDFGADGGAIFDSGETLTLLDDVFTTNVSSEGDGGAVYVEDSQGDVTIRRSQFTGNTAAYDGGAIATNSVYGAIEITDTVISGNTATEGSGGGLYVTGSSNQDALANSVLLTNVTVTGNIAGDGGGGVMLDDIYGPVTIADSTISGNSADWRGGGLYIEDAWRGATVTNTQITGNTSDSDGGGVAVYRGYGPVDISGTTISGNVANGDGGGVWMSYMLDSKLQGDATFTIQTSTVASNHATGSGGGIAVEPVFGEGVSYNEADVTILDSTVSGNTAGAGGGGVFVAYSYGLTSIIQSTISGNVALGGEGPNYDGGAIAFRAASNTDYQLSIVQSTITANAGVDVGGLYMPEQRIITSLNKGGTKPSEAGDTDAKDDTAHPQGDGRGRSTGSSSFRGVATVTGTILAGNTGEDVGVDGTVKATSSIFTKIDSGITFTDLGGNQKNVANLVLGPLQDNGGPTHTIALLPGSPAIDAGSVPPPTYPTNDFDQRGAGYTRVVAGIIDVGAFEVQPVVIQPTFTG